MKSADLMKLPSSSVLAISLHRESCLTISTLYCPSFQLTLAFSPEIRLILDAVDKKFTQDSRFISSDLQELNGVVFISEKSHFSDFPESRSKAAK